MMLCLHVLLNNLEDERFDKIYREVKEVEKKDWEIFLCSILLKCQFIVLASDQLGFGKDGNITQKLIQTVILQKLSGDFFYIISPNPVVKLNSEVWQQQLRN